MTYHTYNTFDLWARARAPEERPRKVRPWPSGKPGADTNTNTNMCIHMCMYIYIYICISN